jgi:hypothetical protein
MSFSIDSLSSSVDEIAICMRINAMNDELGARFARINRMLSRIDVNMSGDTYLADMERIESRVGEISVCEERYHFVLSQKLKESILQKKKNARSAIRAISKMEDWVDGLVAELDSWSVGTIGDNICSYREHLVKTQDILIGLRARYRDVYVALRECRDACE